MLFNVTGTCVTVQLGGRLRVAGIKFQSTVNAIVAQSGGSCTISSVVDFGACTTFHMFASRQSNILITAGYTISGNAAIHARADYAGQIVAGGSLTFTLTGTPAFSNGFAFADLGAIVAYPSDTFSGSATGKRYTSSSNAIVNTNGGGANYLPGSTAGTTATGGIYL